MTQRRSDRPLAQGELDVQAEIVSADAENMQVELEEEDAVGAVASLLDEGNGEGLEDHTTPRQLRLKLDATVNVTGKETKDVVTTAQALNRSLKNLIENFQTGDIDQTASYRLANSATHGTLEQMADFSSAQSLLNQGVDNYVKAVRKVLRTNLDEAVTITFRDLSLTARKPKIGPVEKFSTVSSQLARILCGCCLFVGRAARNAVRGNPPIEWDETPILRNLTGLIRPGKLTLVLGGPGSGKTSFLKALSGKTYGPESPNTVTLGSIAFNGRNVAELRNLAAWVAYVGQSDEHQPLLTVRETLEFAFKSRKAAFYRDPTTLDNIRMHSGEAAVNRVKALSQVEVDIALALLGLNGCANTIIGNENLKGVSGGERRRVTLGEMLVTGSQIICCDEISTGLDSAATYDITSYLRSAAHALQKSIVVALLQPPPEVIDLFDDILVLAEGKITYHGPRDGIQAYFEGLGFRLPVGKDLGDFIVELPTRNGLDMQLDPMELEGLGLPPPPQTPEEFAARWEASAKYKETLEEIERMSNEIRPFGTDYDHRPNRSYTRGLLETTAWSMRLRLRDKTQIAARIVANIIVGLFFGTLFFQLTIDDWWLKAMLFAMALIFLVSTAFPVVQIISMQRPIFFKHVEARFYSAGQFTIAQWLVSLPFVCFDVACFGTSMYWMCGLAPHASSFAEFLMVCISFGMCMNTVMALFPFLTPDEETGIVTAGLFLILSVVASGAVSTESMIPEVFHWLMWLNPLAWSYRALAITEYHTPEYDVWPCSFTIVDIPLVLPVNCQDYFLEVREVRSDPRYIPGAVLFNFAFTFLSLVVMRFAVAKIRFENVKSGAVPEFPTANSIRQGKKRTAAEHRAARRAYENDKYLAAVSPKAMQDISSSHVSLFSPTVGSSMRSEARGVAAGAGYPAAAPSPPSMPGSHLLSPLLTPLSTQGLDMVQIPPKTLIVKDLWYTINIQGEPIDFLQGVTFYAKPGRMTALMGSSGAGKSTLLDTISGRKTVGYARGEILVNGQPKVQHQFVKYTAYVEQFGVHAKCASVRESLEFSAKLRLPANTSQGERNQYVQSVLELLELDDIQNALAGTLSMEQNKRLTLGVELVSNPSIVFCDEPTSGLDARAATIVMRVLLKVARSGRTVVATIHQPSTAIFNFFDDLLLLKRGGQVVYFGELGKNASEMITYLQAVPGVRPCPKNYNPATWMLEVIGAGTGAGVADTVDTADFAALYATSELRKLHENEVETLLEQFGVVDMPDSEDEHLQILGQETASLSRDAQAHGILSPNGREIHSISLDGGSKERVYVRSELTQIKFLLVRNFQTYWRSPEFSLNRLLVVMLFTIVFACFFFRSELNNMGDVVGRIVNVFFFSSLTCIYNLYTIVPFALSRRALYYRERSANMYSVWAFNWAEGLVEVPWLIVQVVATVPLIYYLTNLNATWYAFAYFGFCIFLILLLMTSMGLFAASLFPDALAAQLSSVGALITLMVFCGIMVPLNKLPWPYVPMYYFSFFKYSSEGLLTTQFTGLEDIVCVPSGIPVDLDDSGKLDEWLHHFLPHRNISHGLCSTTGELDFRHPIQALKGLTGIQIKAEHFVLQDFAKDYHFEDRNLDLGVLILWIIALRVLTFLATFYINHQRR